jgi:hypothetical protein
MQSLMNFPFTLVRDDHYVVTSTTGTERVTFGQFLPLTKKAAGQYARQYGGRVIKRTTARKSHLI